MNLPLLIIVVVIQNYYLQWEMGVMQICTYFFAIVEQTSQKNVFFWLCFTKILEYYVVLPICNLTRNNSQVLCGWMNNLVIFPQKNSSSLVITQGAKGLWETWTGNRGGETGNGGIEETTHEKALPTKHTSWRNQRGEKKVRGKKVERDEK